MTLFKLLNQISDLGYRVSIEREAIVNGYKTTISKITGEGNNRLIHRDEAITPNDHWTEEYAVVILEYQFDRIIQHINNHQILEDFSTGIVVPKTRQAGRETADKEVKKFVDEFKTKKDEFIKSKLKEEKNDRENR